MCALPRWRCSWPFLTRTSTRRVPCRTSWTASPTACLPWWTTWTTTLRSRPYASCASCSSMATSRDSPTSRLPRSTGRSLTRPRRRRSATRRCSFLPSSSSSSRTLPRRRRTSACSSTRSRVSQQSTSPPRRTSSSSRSWSRPGCTTRAASPLRCFRTRPCCSSAAPLIPSRTVQRSRTCSTRSSSRCSPRSCTAAPPAPRKRRTRRTVIPSTSRLS
mmetsp:Transcript_36474/g.114336  ORF Transcript_36474/g.114336 Transcript_36474/m.114336 type:complete len:217 (-) Transcript_36474:2304-2954(-)